MVLDACCLKPDIEILPNKDLTEVRLGKKGGREYSYFDFLELLWKLEYWIKLIRLLIMFIFPNYVNYIKTVWL